ncbi:MAG: hypothetical protein F6K42_02060 [Leptolyngbya sp. SIO1D8]|nr:hypothetical protein [Leptolyngbya sp. SIO1D8]
MANTDSVSAGYTSNHANAYEENVLNFKTENSKLRTGISQQLSAPSKPYAKGKLLPFTTTFGEITEHLRENMEEA